MAQNVSKRRLRFSLRGLFVAATLVIVLCGIFLPSIRKQRTAVATIERNGGSVRYAFQFANGFYDANAQPGWIAKLLGVDACYEVVEVNLNFQVVDNTVHQNIEHSAEAWQAVTDLPRIRHLNMEYGESPGESFASVQHLKRLETIRISNVLLGDDAVSNLRHLPELRFIQLYDAGLTDASIRVFTQLPKLQLLNLTNNAITNEGLAELRNATEIRTLFLGGEGSQIDDESVAALQDLEHLKELGLNYTQITGASLAILSKMRSVKILHVGHSNVTWKEADQLKKTRRPDIVFLGGGLR